MRTTIRNTANQLAMSIIRVAQQLAAYIGTKRKESELNRQTLEALNLVPEIQQEIYMFFQRYPLSGTQALDIQYPNQILVNPLSLAPRRYSVLLPKASRTPLDTLDTKRAIPNVICQNLLTVRQELMVEGQASMFPVIYNVELLDVSQPSLNYLELIIEV